MLPTLHADIYLNTAGKGWCVTPQEWPVQAAHKTIILTTEAVPGHLVRKIGKGWTVTELDTPLIPRDVVETHPSREVVGDNLSKLVRDAQNDFGGPLMAISNRAKHIVNTRTHAKAKGSNAFVGKDVVQTMSLMPPGQYEFYEALNAWVGRTDLVRTRHIDEYNQTAGRNLGFRKVGDPKHILLINSTLSECLDGEPKARARYEMREAVGRRQAANAKTKAATPDAFKADALTSVMRMGRLRAAMRTSHL
jgi:hypothetical protein